MIDQSLPRNVVFQQRLFSRERRIQDWAALKSTIASAQDVEAAYLATDAVVNDRRERGADIFKGGVTEGVASEALNFYNHVVADGQYVTQVRKDPGGIARRLGYKISDDALNLVAGGTELSGQAMPMPMANIAVVAVALAVVIVAAKAEVGTGEIVIDESGRVKL